jgi:hypothetical protein
MADSCESTVRARKPTNKQEISEIVQQIIDARMRDSQLDDSGLTTNDIKMIRTIFVEMLQAVFHPRINYPTMPGQTERHPELAPEASGAPILTQEYPVALENGARHDPVPVPVSDVDTIPSRTTIELSASSQPADDDDDSPLPVVPPLRRTSLVRRVEPDDNGSPEPSEKTENKVDTE